MEGLRGFASRCDRCRAFVASCLGLVAVQCSAPPAPSGIGTRDVHPVEPITRQDSEERRSYWILRTAEVATDEDEQAREVYVDALAPTIDRGVTFVLENVDPSRTLRHVAIRLVSNEPALRLVKVWVEDVRGEARAGVVSRFEDGGRLLHLEGLDLAPGRFWNLYLDFDRPFSEETALKIRPIY